MKVKIASLISTLTVAIGRAGLVFLGIATALVAFGLAEAVAIIIAASMACVIFISYTGFFGKQTLKLFGETADDIQRLCQPAEDDSNERSLIINENTPEPTVTQINTASGGQRTARGIGWAIGIVTAVTESVTTYLGWYTILQAVHVSVDIAFPVALTLGSSSVLGWIALAGYPTSDVMEALYQKITGTEPTNTLSKNDEPSTLQKFFGRGLGIVAGIATGSVAYFAITTSLKDTRFASIIPGAILSPFVVIAAGCLYASKLPLGLKGLSQFREHYADIEPTISNIVHEATATTVSLVTGAGAALLTDTSVSTACENFGIADASTRQAIAGAIGATMGFVVTMAAGKDGYSLVKSPCNFFRPAPKPVQIIELDDADQLSLGSRSRDLESIGPVCPTETTRLIPCPRG